MSVHSLEEALQDSAALVDIASEAGVPTADAKRVLAALFDAQIPMQQVVRICSTASSEQTRQVNREARRRR